MPNEGGGGYGGLGSGGNYKKPPARGRGRSLPPRSYTYSPPPSQPHTEHGANIRGPVESGGQQSYYRGGAVVQPRGHIGRGPSGRQVYHTQGAWQAIQKQQKAKQATQPAPRSQVAGGLRNALLAAMFLRNSLPVGQNVGLSSLLVNSRVGHGIAGAEAQQTWDKISALFPKGAQKPDLAFDAPSEAWAYTDRQNGKSTVHLNPSNVRDLTPHSPLASLLYGDTEAYPAPESQRRLVHEFAHSQQTNPMAGAKAEGGAEAFSKVAYQAMNPRAAPQGVDKAYRAAASPRYQALADWYLKNFGARSVLHGQFGQ